MTRYGSELSAISNDIYVEINNESCSLDTLINRQIDFCEAVMCEANAKELYQIKCNLELMAHRIQKWYDYWKHKDFKTDDKQD